MIFSAVICDVDGVLLASPHERAWREALVGLADPDRFTTAIYQAHVAGKPRQDGALAALQAMGVADAARRVDEYARRKQARLEGLIAEGAVKAYPDAVAFVLAVRGLGIALSAASSSKNANAMMRLVPVSPGLSLLDLFEGNVCGRDLRHGKPDPELFLLAASELGVKPSQCLVVEDAPAGVEAALAGGMRALGVARFHDAKLLRAAGAERVVTSLDEVAIADLGGGLLRRANVKDGLDER